jgi:pyruvate/2-oxoglutarate dehydrogenase complex dihydrolipoamide dehydrogenase (E3) component
MDDYDAMIIGTGQSGPSLARRLVAAGQKVAVIERKFFGGTCVNTGCTPTKTLVASAYAAYLARRAGDYGVTIGGPVEVDMKAVKARKDAVAGASRRGVERSLKTLEGCTVYEGHGQFVGTKKVAVDGVVLNADRMFINVGGRALIPSIPGLDQVPYLTNSSMMDVDFLTPHLIVLGGSYIGLEFAQVYRRFGMAIGRRPNTDDLGLDKAGIATDPRGYIQVDDQLRTNVPGIWAMGDCNGRGAFTHTSYNDFEIVAANILDNNQRRVTDRITAYALYTDPPLGRVGMTEAEVRKIGKPALVSTMPMEDVSRAFEKGETKGFMKILVDRDSKQILGASLLGLAGDEVVHCILGLMYSKAPYTVMQRAMHIHPTVSEFIPTMMGELKPLQ